MLQEADVCLSTEFSFVPWPVARGKQSALEPREGLPIVPASDYRRMGGAILTPPGKFAGSDCQTLRHQGADDPMWPPPPHLQSGTLSP